MRRSQQLKLKRSGRKLTRLIPSLNGSCNGIENDGQIEGPGVPPSVGALVEDDLTVVVVELLDDVDRLWTLGDQSTLDEDSFVLGHVVGICKVLDICNQLLLGNAGQGIFDSCA